MRDHGLEQLVRESLNDTTALTEKPMFGGWAWLLDGRMVCGARDDGMLVRLGAGREYWALEIQDVEPMVSRGKIMRGWVRAGPAAYGDDQIRKRLIDESLDFARQQPAK